MTLKLLRLRCDETAKRTQEERRVSLLCTDKSDAWIERNHPLFFKSLLRKRKYAIKKKKTSENILIRELLATSKNHPCTDCQTKYPQELMGFYHRDLSSKWMPISTHLNYTLKELRDELQKCDLLCSNCRILRGRKRMKPQGS